MLPLIFALAFPAVALADDPTMRLHFIDVGQGDATLVEFPCGAMLVDTGAEQNEEFDGVAQLESYLEAFFARRTDLDELDLLLITHPHIDHVRGIQAVLDNYQVESIVDNGDHPGSGMTAPYLQAIEDYVAANSGDSTVGRYREVSTDDFGVLGYTIGSKIIDPFRKCGGANPSVRLLWGGVPTDPGWGADNWGNDHFDDENNHSVVTRVVFGDTTALFMGDLEEVAIEAMLAARRKKDLNADIIQVGHHGSYNATTAPLLEAVTPEIAVIASGPHDRQLPWTAWAYGHPRLTTLELLQEHVTGTRPFTQVHAGTSTKTFVEVPVSEAIYNTAWDGTVVFEADLDGNFTTVEPDWSPEDDLRLTGAEVDWDDLPWSTQSDDILEVTFVDVEEGDAILIQLGDLDLLVDGGRSENTTKYLSSAMDSVTGPLEYLFVTHPHFDHYPGATGVLGAKTVEHLITNGETRGPPRDSSNKTSWDDFETAVTTEGLTIETKSPGDVLGLGHGLTLTFLATGGLYPDTSSGKNINNDSLVMMLEYADRKILLPGDIQDEAGAHLVATYCTDMVKNCTELQADVFKVPHHGSAHFDDDFLAATQADWAVLSAAYRKSYGGHYLPRVDSYEALVALGMEVHSTSADGIEDVKLAIGPDGALAWDAPSGPQYYWTKEGGVWRGVDW